jgi:methyl-accepting chemotaxis protein
MQNRRKTLVVNKKFQYQQTLMIVAVTIIVANAFLLGSTLIPEVPALEITPGVGLAIGLIELALIAGVWYGSIWASNKIAGPVYVFSRQIRLFSEGDLDARISLRNHDFFTEEAAQINASLDRIQQRLEAIADSARSLQDASSTSVVGTEELGNLMEKLAAVGASEK